MSYEDFVMRTVRTQHTPRTLSEAVRDADYACALHYPPPSHKTGTDVSIALVSTLTIAGIFGYMLFSYLDSIPK
jgi:hypothetical protein